MSQWATIKRLPRRCRQTKFRSHILYCDSILNSEHTVYLNIYQNFVLAAMKMHQYIRHWGINTNKSSKFIQSKSSLASLWPFQWRDIGQTLCVKWSGLHMQRLGTKQVIRWRKRLLVNVRFRNITSSGAPPFCSAQVLNRVNRILFVIRLGTHAFHAVLGRKAANYPSLLRHLAFELSLPHHRRSRRRFRALVKEGLISMAQISFWLGVNHFLRSMLVLTDMEDRKPG